MVAGVSTAQPAPDMARPAHAVVGPMAPILHSRSAAMFTARFILFGLVLAQLADALTFTLGVSRFGIGLETNTIALSLYLASGLDAVLLLKGAVVVATIGLMVLAAHRFPRLLIWGGAVATSLGLLGFATNAASILVLS